MIADAIDSFFQILSPPFRAVMLKSVALTAVALLLLGFGLDRLAISLIHVGPAWLAWLLSIAVALGLVVGVIFLAAPTTSLVASFYLDDIAAIVEAAIDPSGPGGRPAPVVQAALMGLRFAALSALVNLVALALLFVPGVGVAAFFLANAYLLGREYFELAAMRFAPAAEARALRRRHAPRVFLAGLIVAGFVAVPIVNLATPLFATALMVRLRRRLA